MFSAVCTDQLQLYEGVLGEIAEQGATLYGVSCDSVYAQKAFKEKLGVSSGQLSDFEPKGAACTAFGVLHAGGFPERALIAIGPDGVVRWSFQASSPGELPGVELPARGSRRPLTPGPAPAWRPPGRARGTAPRFLSQRSLSSVRSDTRKKKTDRRPTGGTGRQ